MALLTLIDNIPLYSTLEEALAWGSAIGITGFHNHVFQGQIGYMPGESHDDLSINLNLLNVSFEDEENLSSFTSQTTVITAGDEIDETVETTTVTETVVVSQDVIDTPQNVPSESSEAPPPTQASPPTGGGGGGY
tara:strand:- start:6 stop:410 length:405 start_codon:yes stop_codon:yes gene_type:complete